MKLLTIVFALILSIISTMVYFINDNANVFSTHIYYGMILVTVICYLFAWTTSRSVQQSNHNKFVRSIMLITFLKFILFCILAAVYIFLFKKTLNKADLFFWMFVYLTYTITESLILAKTAKRV